MNRSPTDQPRRSRPRKPRRRSRLLIWATVLVVVLALVLIFGRAVLLPRYRFPAPGGPFSIGTISRHWIDADRAEILGPEPGGPRELMAQMWYPAEPGRPASGPYIYDADEMTAALARTFGLPRLMLSHLGQVSTNAVEDAPVAGAERFPIVIVLTGTGGFRQSTTFLVEELVSHGFVVVGVDLTYTASAVVFPDGRVAEMPPLDELRPLIRQSYMPQTEPPRLGGELLEDGIVPYLGEDISFVIDELEKLDTGEADSPLAGRLDLERLGVGGVSQGGLVAAEVARTDSRVRAVLIMDAAVPRRTVEAGLDVPAMWLTRPPESMRMERERAGGWAEEEIEAHHRSMRATFDSLRAPGYFVQIPEISHLDFTDAPLWAPVMRWFGLSGPKEVTYAHAVITGYASTFLRRHLSGTDASFDSLAEAYPEVTLDVHHPRG